MEQGISAENSGEKRGVTEAPSVSERITVKEH